VRSVPRRISTSTNMLYIFFKNLIQATTTRRTVIRLFLGPIEVKETRKLISQPIVSIDTAIFIILRGYEMKDKIYCFIIFTIAI
jgi:hypothetical protein